MPRGLSFSFEAVAAGSRNSRYAVTDEVSSGEILHTSHPDVD
jgi:hypothetical protein